MKLHTDVLTEKDVLDCFAKAKAAGKVPSHVFCDTMPSGSRSRRAGFIVKLGTYSKQEGDKRRRTNTGNKGAGDTWAATWDEHGWFMAEVFEKDHRAIFDRYYGWADFHAMTKRAFLPEGTK